MRTQTSCRKPIPSRTWSSFRPWSPENSKSDEKEAMQTFVYTLKDMYYDKLCAYSGRNFSDLITQGEIIEAGLKSGRIINPYTAPETSTRKTPPRKTEGQVSAILPIGGPARTVGTQAQPPPSQAAPVSNTMPPAAIQAGARKPPRKFTALAISYTEAFHSLRQQGKLEPAPARPPLDPLPR